MPELTLLGRYEVEMLLGTGHYAEVYRARDKVLNRQVALKVLKTGLGADDKVVAHFIREARALASLMHPRVCWVWDLGEAQGRHFIAMRLVDGQSLDRLIKQRGSLPWEEALEICLQAAEGLHYAHQKNMVHRDVKPQNILVSPTEGAVLSDFGLVKVFSESTQSSTMAAVGTPAYMAPEAWRDEQVGPPADQYALACVLVEMLTARPLFAGDSAPSVMTRHIMDALELPKSWPSDVPAGLAACLQRALAKQPAARYPDLPAFVQALRGLSVPVQAVPVQASMQLELVPGVSMRFVRIPAGEFLMGSNANNKKTDFADAFLNGFLGISEKENQVLDMRPQHSVYLDEYLMSKYPVTNRQFKVFVDAKGYKTSAEKDGRSWILNLWNFEWQDVHGADWLHPSGPSSNIIGKEDHPVVHVSWEDAQSFCLWVSEITGRRIFIPSEAQWEKAARGKDGRVYPWGDTAPNKKIANFGLNEKSTSSVRKYPTTESPYGCADMVGNVWEWCADWYDENYYQVSPVNNPIGPSTGTFRVVRGGSWYSTIKELECARRAGIDPSDFSIALGFRCCRLV